MKKVLLLIEDNFEDTEAMYPYYRLKEAGFEVEVVGPESGVYHSKHYYPLEAAKGAGDIKGLDDVVGVIIPGGQAPDRMRMNERLVNIVKEAVERGIVVAAICHGPQMLIEADVLRGRSATCYAAIKRDLINAGAKYEDKPVVVDGNLITSRHPADLPAFAKAVVERLGALVPGGG